MYLKAFLLVLFLCYVAPVGQNYTLIEALKPEFLRVHQLSYPAAVPATDGMYIVKGTILHCIAATPWRVLVHSEWLMVTQHSRYSVGQELCREQTAGLTCEASRRFACKWPQAGSLMNI